MVKNQIYTTEQLVLFVKIHELCDLQKLVEAETFWLMHEQCFGPQVYYRLEKFLLNIYKKNY